MRPNCVFCELLRVLQPECALNFLVCSFVLFDLSDKILVCLKTCLWILEAHTKGLFTLNFVVSQLIRSIQWF